MNAFRGQLLASGASLHCSGMFDNWMGQSSSPAPQQTQPQQTPPQGGNPPNNQTNPNPNPENNSGTNDDLIATIWSEAKDPPTNSNDPPPNNPQQPQNPPQRTDEQMRAEISQHLNSVGLGDLTLSAADVEKLASGENSHQEFANIVNTRMQQVYLQAIQSSQKFINNTLETRLAKLKEEAVAETKAFFNGNDLRSHLRKEIPYADDPAIGPMAETVFRQFLVKGADKAKATELTKQYFERVRSAMDPNYVPPNPNTRTTFRGNPRQAMNFIDVLKGN